MGYLNCVVEDDRVSFDLSAVLIALPAKSVVGVAIEMALVDDVFEYVVDQIIDGFTYGGTPPLDSYVTEHVLEEARTRLMAWASQQFPAPAESGKGEA